MMLLKKAKQQSKEAPVEPSLADRIRETCAEAERFIEVRVQELKASHEGKLLPVDWLRGDLRRRHGGHCSCKVVLSIMEQES
jgi:hypothetical protein